MNATNTKESIDTVIARLTQKKNRVTEAEADKNRLDGQRQLLLDGFSKKFGVSTVKQAESKLTQLTKAVDDDEQKLRTGERGLENRYSWQD